MVQENLSVIQKHSDDSSPHRAHKKILILTTKMKFSLAATLSLITAANGFTVPNSRQTSRLGRIQVVSEPSAAVEAATPVESVSEAEAPVAEVAEPEPVPEVKIDPREKIQP